MAEKILGIVRRLRENKQGAIVFGWIRTDDGKEYFFHLANMIAGRMPKELSMVLFIPVPQNVEGKSDRAIEIDIVSEPENVPDILRATGREEAESWLGRFDAGMPAGLPLDTRS